MASPGMSRVWIWAVKFFTGLRVVSDFRTEWENALIMRRDRKRTLTVQAEPDVLGDETADQVRRRIRPAIEALELPVGYSLQWGGEYEASKDAQAAVFGSLPMGYLFMFIITILLFDAVRSPLVIWATVPLAIIGVTFGLLLLNSPFGFMALLGFLSLSGKSININKGVIPDCIFYFCRIFKSPDFSAL